jgi:hypothetical protein
MTRTLPPVGSPFRGKLVRIRSVLFFEGSSGLPAGQAAWDLSSRRLSRVIASLGQPFH